MNRLLAIAAIGCALACDRAEPRPGTVVDDLGHPVPIGSGERVVALVPSATEILVALGAGDRLVARTVHDRQPELAGLPVLGRGGAPSAEAVLALDPTLVVGWHEDGSGPLLRRLRELGVPTYSSAPRSIEDILSTARRLGVLLGLAREADSLVSDLRAEITAAGARACRSRPTMLYLVWHDPPYVAARGSYVGQVIELAGADNAFGDTSPPWLEVSLEEVVLRDPDYLLLPVGPGVDVPADQLERLPGWASLTAVRRGRAIEVDEGLFGRPGPRVAAAIRVLSDVVRSAESCGAEQ